MKRTIKITGKPKTTKPCNGYLLSICATCGAWIEGQPDYCPECGAMPDNDRQIVQRYTH